MRTEFGFFIALIVIEAIITVVITIAAAIIIIITITLATRTVG